jgi:hypothetical protein
MSDTWRYIIEVVAIIILWQLLNWWDRKKVKKEETQPSKDDKTITSNDEKVNNDTIQLKIITVEPGCTDEELQLFLDAYDYDIVDAWYKQNGCMKDYTEQQVKAIHEKIRNETFGDEDKLHQLERLKDE